MYKLACGIDFGTTNTSAAVTGNTTPPKLVPVEKDNLTIPSALFFSDKDIYFGREAMQLYMNGENGRCMRSLKRVLGTGLMKTGTLINNKIIYFENILTYFLTHIKSKIDFYARDNVEDVVLGRPVHFCVDDETGDKNAQNELEKIAKKADSKMFSFNMNLLPRHLHMNKISGKNNLLR